MSYLKELNEEQQSAVKYIEGPQLIIAGAGSGKTRVLTYKIVHLLNNGFNPENILALTFTNKAAREMKERMNQLTDPSKVKKLWMGTFHSIFARILRVEGALLGYTRNFSIYDTEDSKKLIREVVKTLKLDTEQYKPKQIYGIISSAKNNLILPDAYLNDSDIQEFDRRRKLPETGLIYQSYQARIKKADAMDFDDLLLNMNILFRDFPEVLKKYQKIFKYILVDEYQDTNNSQYLIIKKLASIHGKMSLVGDDSQSIYAFRGANIENIFRIQKDFPKLQIFKLEQNYRSTQKIVEAANSLIEKNRNRIPKKIYTNNHEGQSIILKQTSTEKAEAFFVVKKILKLKQQENFDYKDFAVLYRTNAQSRVLESAFREYMIPYKLYGSISFYARKEIKDIVAYLRLIVNKSDEQAIKRIINYPRRGIGNKTIETVQNIANQQNKTFWEVLSEIDNNANLLNAGAIKKLKAFYGLIESFSEFDFQKEVKELVEAVVQRSGLKLELSSDRTPEGIEKYQNVEEFLSAVTDYFETQEEDEVQQERSLETFLEEIALATDQDEEKKDDNKVKLMTIHASKGLEFPVVFIVGVEDGLFPGPISMGNPKDLEEERRLFYVAITRCEKQLYISFAQNRMHAGKYMSYTPSRFINDIDKAYLDFDSLSEKTSDFEIKQENDTFAQNRYKSNQAVQEKRKLSPLKVEKDRETEEIKEFDKESGLKVGMEVEHLKFGKGKVIKLSGTYPESKAIVDFEEHGKKNLLLKFAKLKKISN